MKKFVQVLLACVSGLSLNAQISITSANMPSSGDTLRYTSVRLSSVGDYTTTGANHTWLFDTVKATGQALRSFKPGTSTPYSVIFGFNAYGEKTIDTVPIPTIPVPGIPAIKITDVYNFYSKTSAKFVTEGLGVKINGIPVPNFYSNEDELYFFPLNYQGRDSSTFRFSTITTTLIPFQYIKDGYRITEADGWGTITTPYGTQNCLRVVTTQYSIDTLKGTITLPVIGTQPFAFGFPNYTRSYQWLTTSEKIPYFEVSGNLVNGNFNPTQARYRDNIKSFVGIKEQSAQIALSVFPNPGNSVVSVMMPQTKESVTLTIYDMQGRVVKTQQLDQNQLPVQEYKINVSDLSKGVYTFNLRTSTQAQNIKISVQ